MPTMPGMGLTLSPDPTPVLILAVSSAFITTIVSTTDYTLNNNIQVVQEKLMNPDRMVSKPIFALKTSQDLDQRSTVLAA